MKTFVHFMKCSASGAGLSAAMLSGAVLLLTLHAALAFTEAETVYANGASTIIMNQVQGPYRMVVGIIPARPVIPQTHLAIQVFDASDERLLRDTDVDLQVVATGPPGASTFGPEQVLNEQTLRYFEVDVPFEIIGPWDVSVSVSSHLGEEEFVLNLEVEEPRAQIQWVWITGVLVAIFAVGVWTWLTLRRRRNLA